MVVTCSVLDESGGLVNLWVLRLVRVRAPFATPVLRAELGKPISLILPFFNSNVKLIKPL